MADLRKFRLTEWALPFEREGLFGFKLRFEKPHPNGVGIILKSTASCPLLQMHEGEVVATTNGFAGECLAKMVVPNKTFRNGENRAPDGMMMFEEVDPSTEHHLDLDPIFDEVEA